MNCGYCGAEVKNRRGYCLHCGTKQETPVEIVPEEVTAPVVEVPEVESVPPEVAMESPAAEDREALQRSSAEEETVENWPAFEDGEDDLGYCPDVPALVLPTGRGLGKMIFLGILTLGIYPTVIWSRMVTELNIAASRRDGKRTMPYLAMLLLVPVTLGIFGFVWMHRFCGRIGAELMRRGLGYRFGARDFWLWNVLGILILVGPFVFVHKLTKAMNKINENFNSHG